MQLRHLLVVTASIFTASSALAFPVSNGFHSSLMAARIYSPDDVTAGSLLTTYSGARTSDTSGSPLNNGQLHTLETQYGYTNDFSVGVIANADRVANLTGTDVGHGTEPKGYGLEAQYKFTGQGQYWLSSAVRADYLLPIHNNGSQGDLGLLLSRKEGPVTVTGNFTLGHQFDNDQTDNGVSVTSALQGVYSLNKYINPGVEWVADLGKTNDMQMVDNQGQYLGPIITGNIADIGNGSLNYTAGYYAGMTNASANEAARLQLSYAVKF